MSGRLLRVCVCVCMWPCKYLCMYVCMYVYIYISVCIYVYECIHACIWGRAICAYRSSSLNSRCRSVFACGGVTVMGKHWPAASNNGFGGVALADKVGVYVFESLSQDLNSSSDSDDEVSHVSTESGSLISHSEYESVVKNFGALENQWLNEPDSLQQETLYKSIFEAEVAFAIKFRIYSHLITGNQKEVSVAKEKVRN